MSFVSSKPDPYPTPVDVVVYLISAIMNRVIKRFYCTCIRIPIIKIRQSHLYNGNPIPGKTVFKLKKGPVSILTDSSVFLSNDTWCGSRTEAPATAIIHGVDAKHSIHMNKCKKTIPLPTNWIVSHLHLSSKFIGNPPKKCAMFWLLIRYTVSHFMINTVCSVILSHSSFGNHILMG